MQVVPVVPWSMARINARRSLRRAGPALRAGPNAARRARAGTRSSPAAARSGASEDGLYRAATARRQQKESSAVPDVEAHITGTVWKVECQIGQQVTEGDTLVILESMKMEMPVEAEDDGTVKEIVCQEGQSVSEGDTLVVLE